jgi:hypothetical protein
MIGHPATLITMMVAVAVARSTRAPKPAPQFVCNASESGPNAPYRVQPVGKLMVTDLVVGFLAEALATLPRGRRLFPTRFAVHQRIFALCGQTVCRRDLLVLIDGIEMGGPASVIATVARSPSGNVFRENWDEPVVARRWSFSGRCPPPWPPSRTAMDLRTGVTMQPLCKPPAVPRFDQKPHRSSVPNKFQSAVAAAAVESPPSDCDPRGGRRAGALGALPFMAETTTASLWASGWRYN